MNRKSHIFKMKELNYRVVINNALILEPFFTATVIDMNEEKLARDLRHTQYIICGVID